MEPLRIDDILNMITDTIPSVYPQTVAMRKVQSEHNILLKFMDWLNDKDMQICKWNPEAGEYCSQKDKVSEILLEYFGIDSQTLAAESTYAMRQLVDALHGYTDVLSTLQKRNAEGSGSVQG